MRLPSAGVRYLDHLVTHETCHQWFWNVVGTDGYAETFMDEGLVNGFTALRLDAKYGRNAPLIVWPQGLSWLPTIGREDLRLSGYYGWRARGNNGPVIQDLKAMGNLGTLFSLAYDRGGKVIEMIHNRLGPDRFFAFFRKIYHDYAFKTFHYADLKRELAAFDPGFDWATFLDGWLIEHGETDWSVERVAGRPAAAPTAATATVTVELKQSGRDGRADGRALPLRRRRPARADLARRGSYDVPGAHVTHAAEADRWVVTVQAPAAPSQVMVDPDHALLDAVPDNNRWKPEVAWRFTPVDDAARRVVAVPGVRPALGRRRAVRRPVRPGRRSRSAPSGSTAGSSRSGPAPSRPCARRSSAASSPSSTSPGRSGRRASSTRKGSTTSTTTSGTRAAGRSSATGSSRRRAS